MGRILGVEFIVKYIFKEVCCQDGQLIKTMSSRVLG